MISNIRSIKHIVCWVLLLLLVGCENTDEKDEINIEKLKKNIVSDYSNRVLATYLDAQKDVELLKKAVKKYTDQPSPELLEAAKEAWLAARETYLLTEVFRFYEGPIDDIEGYINAWPLDEAYIDYVVDDPGSGIINDVSLVIDKNTLMRMNEAGGEENIATGYHAIEFLLWGQDLSVSGAGNRGHTDYLATVNQHSHRRALYINTVSVLLLEHITSLVQQWQDNDKDNYRAQFESMPTDQAIKKILTGMVVLSGFETGGERLQAAYDSADQEDEHSCFSDNTHRDMIQDIQGIYNVWHGIHHKKNGLGIKKLAEVTDMKLFKQIDQLISSSLEQAKQIKAPFDQEISRENPAGRERVKQLIVLLRQLEKSLLELMTQLDLSLPETEH